MEVDDKQQKRASFFSEDRIATCRVKLPILKRGCKHYAVKNMKRILKSRGYNPGRINIVFSEKCEKALLAFQKRQGLEESGISDAKTWEELLSVLKS